MNREAIPAQGSSEFSIRGIEGTLIQLVCACGNRVDESWRANETAVRVNPKTSDVLCVRPRG